MLERLKGDCEYYLGAGKKHANGLWAVDEEEQILTMVDIWKSLSDKDKPEFITWEDIVKYAKGLGVDI
jgi:hypothetical protein